MKSDQALQGDSAWRDCTPGELVQLGAQQQRRAGRRALLRGLGMAAASCAAAGAVGLAWYRQPGPQRNQPFAPGGLVCDDVRRLLPAYVANQLEPQRANKVRLHLAACSHCREAMRTLQSHKSAG